MFCVNEDMSIYVTRGDTVIFRVTADSDDGKYIFHAGDVVRFKVTEKKACENVMFYKDFGITEETDVAEILLTEEDTKIGDVISKPTDYWYEIELNPFTNPQTIVGYDEDGAKVFKLFPEGNDVESTPVEPEDIPIVDAELDLTSERPVQNRAVAREVVSIRASLKGIERKLVANDGTEFKFGVNEKGEYGYVVEKDGADTVIPFKRALGNAQPWQVLETATFTNEDGELHTGTMNDYSSTTLPTNEMSGDITDISNLWETEKGRGCSLLFHPNFSGYVTPETIITQNVYGLHPDIVKAGELMGGNGSPEGGYAYGTYTSDATASATDILNGKTAYVNGKKIIGTSTDKADFQEYKKAIIDGLKHSGIEVSDDTTAEELFAILAEEFPEKLVLYEVGKYTTETLPFKAVTNVIPIGVTVSGTYATPEISVYDSDAGMRLYWGNGDTHGAVISDEKIKLTSYKSIKITLNLTDAESMGVLCGVLYSQNSADVATVDESAITFDLNKEVILDGIEGRYYIGIFGCAHYTGAYVPEIVLTAYNARERFELSFETAQELVEYNGGYYMTLDTYGDNWKVSDETTSNALVFNNGINKLRLFYTDDYDFFRAMSMNRNYVFEFTAPASGDYNLVANAVLAPSHGKADIYVNDTFIKTIDTYGSEQAETAIDLGKVTLEKGEYANKIRIYTSGKTSGSNAYAGFTGFTFKVAE